MNKSKIIVVICDANVLIDFLKTDQTVLLLCARHLFRICVPLQILKEVRQLSPTSAKKLGIHVVEPELDELVNARKKKGRLSFEDLICLEMAKSNGWVCATNDKVLRKECSAQNVRLIWGFDFLLQLNLNGHIIKVKATQIVKEIQKLNLRIRNSTINEFIRKLK